MVKPIKVKLKYSYPGDQEGRSLYERAHYTVAQVRVVFEGKSYLGIGAAVHRSNDEPWAPAVGEKIATQRAILTLPGDIQPKVQEAVWDVFYTRLRVPGAVYQVEKGFTARVWQSPTRPTRHLYLIPYEYDGEELGITPVWRQA